MIFYIHRQRTTLKSSDSFKNMKANPIMTPPERTLSTSQNEAKIISIGPFRLAGEGLRLLPPALSVPNVGIQSSLTLRLYKSSPMAKLSGPKSLTTKKSVSTSTLASHALATTELNESMSASSADPKVTMPGLAAQVPTEEFALIAHTPRLLYPSFTSSIHHCPQFDNSIHIQPNLFGRIISPYDANTFSVSRLG